VYDGKSLEKLHARERANEVLDAVIAFVEKCEWSDRIELQPPIAELGLKPGKVMGLVYTAVEGASAVCRCSSSIGLRDAIARCTGCEQPDRSSPRGEGGRAHEASVPDRPAHRTGPVLPGLIYLSVTFVQVWMASRRDEARRRTRHRARSRGVRRRPSPCSRRV